MVVACPLFYRKYPYFESIVVNGDILKAFEGNGIRMHMFFKKWLEKCDRKGIEYHKLLNVLKCFTD